MLVVVSGWKGGGRDHGVKSSADICGGYAEGVWVWARLDAIAKHVMFVPCMVEWFQRVGSCDGREYEYDREQLY